MSEGYKTLDEFFPSGRGDGSKFTKHHWPEKYFIEPLCRDRGGIWHSANEVNDIVQSLRTDDFREWHPPKTKKKVTLYKPVFKVPNGEVFCHPHIDFSAVKMTEPYCYDGCHVGWMEVEVFVDE